MNAMILVRGLCKFPAYLVDIHKNIPAGYVLLTEDQRYVVAESEGIRQEGRTGFATSGVEPMRFPQSYSHNRHVETDESARRTSNPAPAPSVVACTSGREEEGSCLRLDLTTI